MNAEGFASFLVSHGVPPIEANVKVAAVKSRCAEAGHKDVDQWDDSDVYACAGKTPSFESLYLHSVKLYVAYRLQLMLPGADYDRLLGVLRACEGFCASKRRWRAIIWSLLGRA